MSDITRLTDKITADAEKKYQLQIKEAQKEKWKPRKFKTSTVRKRA